MLIKTVFGILFALILAGGSILAIDIPLVPSATASRSKLEKQSFESLYARTESSNIHYTPHDPIYIRSYLEFTAANGVVSGSGTEMDPYIIEGWDINATTFHGIYIYEPVGIKPFFIIRNCVVHGGKTTGMDGIHFDKVWVTNGVGRIDNVEVFDNSIGISLEYSSPINITDCRVHDNGDHGIYIYESGSLSLSGSMVHPRLTRCEIYNNNGKGIFFTACHYGGEIVDCHIYNNAEGIYIAGEFFILRNNVLENNTYNFGVDGAPHTIDTSNTIDGKPIYYVRRKSHIVFNETMDIGYLALIDCENILVSNLTLEHNYQGILIQGGTPYSTLIDQSITVKDCHFHDNYEGISIVGGSFITFRSCRVYNNFQGICLDGSDLNKFTECEIYNNSYGIYAHYWVCSSYNKFASCQLYGNVYGVYLVFSSDNVFDNFEIHDNSYGIYLGWANNGKNQIHHSNIYNNTGYGAHNYKNESQYALNATLCWWGSNDGPGGAGPGGGDNVSSNVLYEPWLEDPYSEGNRLEVEYWAVIIGVGQFKYLNSSYTLDYCDDDVLGLASALQQYPCWKSDHIRILLNENATKESIKNAVTDWLDPREKSNDVVLVYFSGHGAAIYDYYVPYLDEKDDFDECLVTYDSTESGDNMITDDEMRVWLMQLDSANILVILDSCHSGGFDDLRVPGERVILAATNESGHSYRHPLCQQSVFTYYIVQALNNTILTAEGIFDYVKPKIDQLKQDVYYMSDQWPQIYDDYTGSFSIAGLLRDISGDLNGDKTVDIYDAIILALAFEATPGTPDWNANADINGDNVVDVYDAIMLANNYGKTA